jgi:hypothetical protein
VHLDDRVPLGLAHVDEHLVPQDPCVVDNDVEPAECVDGLLDKALGAVPRRDVIGVGDRLPTRRLDVVDHLLSRPSRAAGAVTGPTEVVDDDAGSFGGERKCVCSPDAVAGTGHDDDPAVTDSTHRCCLLVPRPVRRAIA